MLNSCTISGHLSQGEGGGLLEVEQSEKGACPPLAFFNSISGAAYLRECKIFPLSIGYLSQFGCFGAIN